MSRSTSVRVRSSMEQLFRCMKQKVKSKMVASSKAFISACWCLNWLVVKGTSMTFVTPKNGFMVRNRVDLARVTLVNDIALIALLVM